MEPSPVRTVSIAPPPLIFPRRLDWLIEPESTTGNSRLMRPSLVWASRSAWNPSGRRKATLPSPVRTVQPPAIFEPGSARASTFPSPVRPAGLADRSEEHTSELQSLAYLVCRLLLEKK